MVKGVVEDWEALESMLYYVLYTQLGWRLGGEGNLLIAEPPQLSRREREHLTQLAFEIFNVDKYCAECQPVLSMFGVGRLNGVVVDVGFEKIDIVPVLEGGLHPTGSKRVPYGGLQLDLHLQNLLAEHNFRISDDQVLQAMKEACIRVDQPEYDESVSYTLPDGQTIDITQQGKALGNALIMGLNCADPLALIINSAANITTPSSNDKEARKLLFENILLCGGGCDIPGLGLHIINELKQWAYSSATPTLVTLPEYMPPQTMKRAAWMGGAALAKVAFMAPAQHISKAEYDEWGPTIIHRKM